MDEIKGFKHQITVKDLLRKQEGNGDLEFASVYFNSTTKTVFNCKYMRDKSFQEVILIKDMAGWSVNKLWIREYIYFQSIIRKFIHWIT